MIYLYGIVIKKQDFAVLVVEDKIMTDPYKVIVYVSDGSYHDFYEQPSETGYKSMLFPIKDSLKYTVAIHEKYGQLMHVKFYEFDDLNITEYNPLELDHDSDDNEPKREKESKSETEKEPEPEKEQKEEDNEIKLEIKKINIS